MNRNVYLSGGDVERNILVNAWGREIHDGRDLVYFMAHEIAHAQHERRVGLYRFFRMPDWIREGYADRVGRGNVWLREGVWESFAGGGSEWNEPTQDPYQRYNLMVACHLDGMGWSIESLSRDAPSLEQAEIAITEFLQKRSD